MAAEIEQQIRAKLLPDQHAAEEAAAEAAE